MRSLQFVNTSYRTVEILMMHAPKTCVTFGMPQFDNSHGLGISRVMQAFVHQAYGTLTIPTIVRPDNQQEGDGESKGQSERSQCAVRCCSQHCLNS